MRDTRFSLRLLYGLCLTVSAPAISAFAQNTAPEITLPTVTRVGEAATVIAIPTFEVKGESGGIAPETFHQIIYNDLEIFSDFKRVANQSFVNDAQRRDAAAGRIDFAEWQRLNANLVLKATYFAAGGMIGADCYLWDVDNRRQMLGPHGLRYTNFPADNPRRLAHRISDDIVRYVFKEVGIASTRIAFVSARGAPNHTDIYVMDADGANVRRLTFDNSIVSGPCWGMNATEIYFTSYRSRFPDLCGVRVGGGAVWDISRRVPGNFSPDWSPQAQRIVFTLGRNGNSEIYTMDRSGQEQTLRRLTNDPRIDSTPCWSPDGTQIAFASDRSGAIHLYVMNADGSNQRRLTFQGNYNVNPAWSPKGDRIAFAGRDQGTFDIYLINVDGTGLKQLTAGQGNNEDPSWAPDGEHLAFCSDRLGRYARTHVFVMRADGANQHQITREGFQNKAPAWSPAPLEAR